MTSGREESGADEELHHSSSRSRSKEWQVGGGGGQPVIQEQLPDSRSPPLGLAAPAGVNLHKEPEGQDEKQEEVDAFKESEYSVHQGMSSKEVQDLVKSKGRFRVDQVNAEESIPQKSVQSDTETLEAELEETGVEKEEEEKVQEEDVKLDQVQDEVESENTLLAAGDEGKGVEDMQSGEVDSLAKSGQVDPHNHDGLGDELPVQLDPDLDLPLLHRGLAEQEKEEQRGETDEVKVIEEQILNFDANNAEKNVEVRRNDQPQEHDPDHLSDSLHPDHDHDHDQI